MKMLEGIRDKFKGIPREKAQERRLDEAQLLELRKDVERLERATELKIGGAEEQRRNEDMLFAAKNKFLDLMNKIESLKNRNYY